jgi:hypothetical protein
MATRRRCFFRDIPGSGPCNGRLIKAHLIPQQTLKRELNAGPAMLKDPRGWTWMCGGPVGVSGHHGRFDSRGCNPVRIPRSRLPEPFVAWMDELGLGWFVDRAYPQT